MDPSKSKVVDIAAALKSEALAGTPLQVLLNARRAENGVAGYELGYRGKTAGIVDNYEPDEWQYGEWARRMNYLLWQEALKTSEGRKLILKAVEVYTGKPGKVSTDYLQTLTLGQ